jgi:hypothetical protein
MTMVDLALVRTVLEVLSNNGRPMTEELVGIDVEVKLRRPSIAHLIRGALRDCTNNRWATEDCDEWGQPTFKITPAGVEKLKAF